MLENIYILFTLIPLVIFFLTLFINLALGPRLSKKHKINDIPKLSVLIPARNEEANIAKCLLSLENQSIQIEEIIVLDDNSTDNTSKIIEEIMQKHKNIKLISGEQLPEGWLGKNWACHQIATEAKGDVLLFIDADTEFAERALESALYLFDRYKLDFLSAFPTQRAKTFWGNVLMPIIDIIAYSGFIFQTALRLKHPSFIASIGQFMMFSKKAYFEIGGHKSLKSNVVEDVNLGRKIKQKGFKAMSACGKNFVFTDMYGGFEDIWKGFSKNLYGIASNNFLLFTILLLISFNSFVIPFILIFTTQFAGLAKISLLIIFLWRMMNVAGLGHNLLSLIMHPIAFVIYFAIGINSMYIKHFGTIGWKGRIIKTDSKL